MNKNRWLCLALTGMALSSGAAVAAPSIHPLLKPMLRADRSAAVSGALAPDANGRFGFWIRGNDGSLRSARWTSDELRAAALDPGILSIGPAVLCHTLLDSSLIDTGARRVHGPHGFPPAYNGPIGTHTIVGIVDTGIDLQHADFQRSGGGTRILGLWDQTIASTDPPRNFSYGKEWTRAQIDAGRSSEVDQVGHGTHVAGIAAGNGSATGNGQTAYRYVGMAPDADIVFVKTDFLTTSIVDGVKYVFQKADSMGLPAVVNLSLGTQFGPHDGTDDMSRALAALTGPGRVIVGAAGNEQGKGLHARRVISAVSDTARITLNLSSYTPQSGAQNDEIDLDGWFPPTVSLTVSIWTPGGTLIGPVPMGSAVGTSTPEGRVEIDNTLIGINGDRNVVVQLIDQTFDRPPAPGIWRIDVANAGPPPAEGAGFDVWNFYQTIPSRFFYGADETDLVLAPANGDSVIAVGAYVTRESWIAENGTRYAFTPPLGHGELAPFSSNGYRRDGVIKPDISAPGRGIASSLSSQATGIDTHLIVQDGVHVVFEGTSMAAPHVAGLVALMFERLGPRGVLGIRSQLTSTARIDGFTGQVPNRAWGYGKIDAVRAVGFDSPVVLVEAEARQVDDRMHVRFVLSEDAGTAPLPVWREDGELPARQPVGWTSSGRERTFVDSTLSADGNYSYWLDISGGGDGDWIGPARGHFTVSRRVSLSTHPNPFLARTAIRWAIPAATGGTLTIHDVGGRAIRSFACAPRTAGTIEWDGTDRSGHPVAAGLYLARLEAGGATVERRILRLR